MAKKKKANSQDSRKKVSKEVNENEMETRVEIEEETESKKVSKKELKAQQKAEIAKEKQDRKAAKKAKRVGLWKRIRGYFKDLKSELKKVVWPTRSRVFRGTIVVITMVVVVAVFVMALDFGFNHLIALLFGEFA